MCTIFIHYYNLCGHTPFTITTKILDQHTPSYSFNYYFYNISIFHYRFFYKSASWEMSNEDFDKLLSSYLEHHGESPTITTYSGNISQVSEMKMQRHNFTFSEPFPITTGMDTHQCMTQAQLLVRLKLDICNI